jgi:hypothetical protein
MKSKESIKNETVRLFRLSSRKNVKKDAREAEDPSISPLLSVS